jgi:hypothetical protein
LLNFFVFVEFVLAWIHKKKQEKERKRQRRLSKLEKERRTREGRTCEITFFATTTASIHLQLLVREMIGTFHFFTDKTTMHLILGICKQKCVNKERSFGQKQRQQHEPIASACLSIAAKVCSKDSSSPSKISRPCEELTSVCSSFVEAEEVVWGLLFFSPSSAIDIFEIWQGFDTAWQRSFCTRREDN